MRAADEALYESKKRGCNRAVVNAGRDRLWLGVAGRL